MTEALGMSVLEIIFAIVNFLILVGVLAKFLYKPFLSMLEQRNLTIKSAFDNAEATNRRADEKLEAYNKRIANVEDDGREIIKNAKERADDQAKDIIEEATARSNNMMMKAENNIRQAEIKAKIRLKNEVASIALLAAEKILEKEISAEAHSQLIDSIIEQAGESGWNN